MKRSFVVAILALVLTARAGAETVPAPFAPVAFLLGTWSGSGRADVGAGSGTDSFRLDLGGRVVVRRAHSTYPGSPGVQPSTYEGLMIVYPVADPAADLRADSYDNGGHVIHYALVRGTAPNVVQFLSDGPTALPTFRLTYELHGSDVLDVTFELAPPGSADFHEVARGVERRMADRPGF